METPAADRRRRGRSCRPARWCRSRAPARRRRWWRSRRRRWKSRRWPASPCRRWRRWSDAAAPDPAAPPGQAPAPMETSRSQRPRDTGAASSTSPSHARMILEIEAQRATDAGGAENGQKAGRPAPWVGDLLRAQRQHDHDRLDAHIQLIGRDHPGCSGARWDTAGSSCSQRHLGVCHGGEQKERCDQPHACLTVQATCREKMAKPFLGRATGAAKREAQRALRRSRA